MADAEKVSIPGTSQAFNSPPFATPFKEVVSLLETDLENGLKTSKIQALQTQYGRNELEGGGGVNPLEILIRQVFNAMMLVMIMAMAVSLGIQSWIESGVIGGVILINVVVGFIQEYSSAKTMASLLSLATPSAVAIRDGVQAQIASADLVPGDIICLKTGDVIPADCRLYEAVNFESDEALLTGESVPVAKDDSWEWKGDGDCLEVGVGDRINMAFSSALVTKGRSKGIVTAIGMGTEIGSIARQLASDGQTKRQPIPDANGNITFGAKLKCYCLIFLDGIGSFLGVNKGTPLQRTLSKLAVGLFGIAIVFAIVVFAANRFANIDREVVLYAVATALSMIPASLVVVLTITLAGGTRAMANRNVIVRTLDSLEALGAVTDICSDKTGTLTQGRMVVRAGYILAKGTVYIGENNEPFNPHGAQLTWSSLSPAAEADRIAAPATQTLDLKNPGNEGSSQDKRAPEIITSQQLLDNDKEGENAGALEKFLEIAGLCNLASVIHNEEKGWVARGDPTECAIQVFAHRFPERGRQARTTAEEGKRPEWTQTAEYPFDSDTKRMSVIFNRNRDNYQAVFTKGAVERIFPKCTKVHLPGGVVPILADFEDVLMESVEALAEQGLRVLALAYKDWDGTTDAPRDVVENDLTLMGVVGLYDPPRPETQGAVRKCHEAGISVHMLTGDHHSTAQAIARQVGILPRNTAALSKDVYDCMVWTAAQFDRLTDEEIDALPLLPLVIARCAPSTKVRMVDALHRRNLFCAMTGDGVNDAPSLKRADIGIAMGMNGSDVAKDASDLVLTNDQFDSILNAVEEGRRISDNISKFVLHLLAQNVILAISLLVGLAFKDRQQKSVFPLSPIEILYVLMVTSGFPAMGIGAQAAAPDVLRRPPRKNRNGVFTWEMIIDMFAYGIAGAAICLATFVLIVYGFGDGNLGHDSNNSLDDDPGSRQVFRARSATFGNITWISLILAFEVIDMKRSFFRRVPKTQYPWTQWIRDIWDNKMLFYSCIFGFVSIFPIIYIPGLNTVVMKHAPISWEWALVFIGSLIFWVFCEAWKLGKRIYSRRKARAEGLPDPDNEDALLPIFKEWATIDASRNPTLNNSPV